MDNKKTILFMFGMFVVFGFIFVTAQGLLSANNPSIKLSDRANDKLVDMGLDSPTISPLKCGSDICEFSIYKGDFKLGTHRILRKKCLEYEVNLDVDDVQIDSECISETDHTDKELQDLVEDKTEKVLENYGNVFKDREEVVEKESVLSSGIVSIN